MGEIKSTLEIALEKAKAVEVSSEERKRFKREDALAKARDIFEQFINHPSRSRNLPEEIKKSGKDPSVLKECLAEILLGAIDLSRSTERIWQGLQQLGLGDTDPFKEALSRLVEDSNKARTKEAESLEKVLRESLGKAGISGTAVDPNVEGSSQWKDFISDLDQRVSGELQRLRQEIACTIEGRNNSPR